MIHNQISILYVRRNSIYKTLGFDCWDIDRDARKWPGGNAIVAHPPCRAWGKYKAFAKPREGEKELARQAIRDIRKYGGVLEHPRHSGLWDDMNLPKPGTIDQWGGYSICVDQFWWGHKAQKNTLLYICGCPLEDLPDMPIKFDAVTHYVGFPKNFKVNGIPKNGMKEITKAEREATPIDFAKWLAEVAIRCDVTFKTILTKTG